MRLKISLAMAEFMLLANSVSILAADETSPRQIVEALYKPYLADLHAKKPTGSSALDLILPYASKSLQTAIQKNQECEQHTHEICNIDFDIIINAQDWDLSNFAIQEESQKSLPIVSAIFSNGEKNKVSYFFVHEENAWKIDDIVAILYKRDGAIDYRYTLKKELIR